MGKPIVKWAGGKSRLLGELLCRVPDRMRVYAEPFSGGAALFFALPEAEKKFKKAILSDQNADLIACYRAVRDDVDTILRELKKYKYERELFYQTRDRDVSKMSDAERGARFLFLNRTCYNGLWRVNAKGQFNVPFGRYKNPRIVDEENLREASAALQNVDLRVSDFSDVLASLRKDDFAYVDPPYVPVSKTAAFTSYASGGFSDADQVRLLEAVRRAKKRGVNVMLSNADTARSRELYEEFAVHIVKVARPINSDAKKRGDAREVIVTTWEKPGVYEEKVQKTHKRAS